MGSVPEECDHVRKIWGARSSRFTILFFNNRNEHIRSADEEFATEVPCDRRMTAVNRELHARQEQKAHRLTGVQQEVAI